MDLIELMDKNKKLGQAFYLYVIFSIVNMGIHVANYYHGFLPDIGDYALYLIKIIVCLFVLITINKNMLPRYQGVAPVMRLMIFLDISELLASIPVLGEKAGDLAFKVLVIMILKAILDFFFYFEVIQVAKDKIVFIIINLLLIPFFVLSFYHPVWIVVFVIVVCRYIFGLLYVRSSMDSCNLENYGKSCNSIFPKWNEAKSSFAIRAVCYGLLGCALLVTFVLKHYNPKSVFDNSLKYDDTGIAYDYDGHFIDQNGNTVISLPEIVKEKRSVRTSVFNSFYGAVKGTAFDKHSISWYRDMLELSCADDHVYANWHNDFRGKSIIYSYDRDFHHDDGYKNTYFYKNASVFYSDAKGAYGMINDKGEVILEPCLYDFQYQSPEIMTVFMKGTGMCNAVNQEGKLLFGDNHFSSIEVDTEKELLWGKKFSWILEEYENDNSIVDYSGNEIYSGFAVVYMVSDNDITVEKVENGKRVKIVIDKSGKELSRIID